MPQKQPEKNIYSKQFTVSFKLDYSRKTLHSTAYIPFFLPANQAISWTRILDRKKKECKLDL